MARGDRVADEPESRRRERKPQDPLHALDDVRLAGGAPDTGRDKRQKEEVRKWSCKSAPIDTGQVFFLPHHCIVRFSSTVGTKGRNGQNQRQKKVRGAAAGGLV